MCPVQGSMRNVCMQRDLVQPRIAPPWQHLCDAQDHRSSSQHQAWKRGGQGHMISRIAHLITPNLLISRRQLSTGASKISLGACEILVRLRICGPHAGAALTGQSGCSARLGVMQETMSHACGSCCSSSGRWIMSSAVASTPLSGVMLPGHCRKACGQPFKPGSMWQSLEDLIRGPQALVPLMDFIHVIT